MEEDEMEEEEEEEGDDDAGRLPPAKFARLYVHVGAIDLDPARSRFELDLGCSCRGNGL